MIRANLLPIQRQSVRLLGLRFEVSQLRRVVSAAALIIASAAFVFVIESTRLRQLEALERHQQVFLVQNASKRSESHRLALELSRLQELERTAAALRDSGNSTALQIARIGNAVPRHVWFDHLVWSAGGFNLSGRSASMDYLVAAVGRLDRVFPGKSVLISSVEQRENEPLQFTARLSLDAAE